MVIQEMNICKVIMEMIFSLVILGNEVNDILVGNEDGDRSSVEVDRIGYWTNQLDIKSNHCEEL
jgi:hypothetical protein